MDTGLPIRLLGLVLCTRDGGRLRVENGADGKERLEHGRVACETCGASYEVRDGILDLLGSEDVADEQSRFEMHARDLEAVSPDSDHQDRLEMEVPRTLRELGDVANTVVLEVGCGTGLYTRRLVPMGAAVVALDFSRASLLANARSIGDGAPVAFVRADVARMRLAPGAFDAALSTLYSNLPTRDVRRECNRRVFEALKPGGRYVVSCHHHGMRRRLAGLPTRTRYAGSGVFAEYFTKESFRSELEPFGRTRISSICIWVPYASRVARTRAAISSVAERLPFLGGLGSLLLANTLNSGRRDDAH